MRTQFMSTIFATTVLVLAPLSLDAQGGSRVSLERIMSQEERAATGVGALAPAQRAALEAWLARYTATVTAVAAGLTRGETRGAEHAQPPEPGRVAPPRAPVGDDTIRPPSRRRPHTIPDGIRVYRSAGGGTFVMLEDGSMWEIFLRDRPYTVTWQAGDYVLVRHNPAPTNGYEFVLINAAGRMEASARFAGRVERPVTPESR